MTGNPLPWPEIKHLPDYFRSILEAHIRFREDPECNDTTVRAPLSKEKLNELVFDVQWCANIKYDGTNLAITTNNELYGRRQKIESVSYQKADVTFLSKIDLSALSNELLGDFKEKVKKFFVYGELVVNNLYDYTNLNIYNKWIAFGICMEISDSEIGKMIHEKLVNAGYVCNSLHKVVPGSVVKITVLLNEKLRQLFISHNIPVGTSIVVNKSLYDLITLSKDWMINGNGEGLVCVSNEFQKKWKIGAEHQPSIFENFREILTKISTYDDLDDRIVEAANIFFQVIESRKIMGNEAAKKKVKPPKVKVDSIFPNEQMKGAIESALTKYDSLESYFESKKMKEIVNFLIKEVMDDLMPTIDSNVIVANATKEINDSVRKYVGIRYGMWKGVKRE